MPIVSMELLSQAGSLELPGSEVLGEAAQGLTDALPFVSDPKILIAGIILIIVAVLFLVFIKKILINSVLGIIAWAVLQFLFGVNLPFTPSLVISAIFGLAGIGAMLILRFMGVL